MDIKIVLLKDFEKSEKTIILPLFEKEDIGVFDISFCQGCNDKVKGIIDKGIFNGKMGETFVVPLEHSNLILAGIGKKEDFELENLGEAIAAGINKAKSLKKPSCHIISKRLKDMDYNDSISYQARVCSLSDYAFDKYKEKNDGKDEIEVYLVLDSNEEIHDLDKIVEHTKNKADAISLVRDLVNEPANVLTPIELANRASENAGKYGYEIEVMNEQRIKDLGMGAYLAVAQGSDNPPRLIVMRYKGNPESNSAYALIGKGMMYDTGGYSIKPSNAMKTMYCDMAGAATVIGAMNMIASAKLNINVTGIIAACENSISGHAYRPGDIVKSMSGKYIEVDNTDAEGRLTLADAITYAIKEENANTIIDLATLTGAVISALGDDITGVMSNNDSLYSDFREASNKVGERIHRLPLYKPYLKRLKSSRADILNTGKPGAGTITAGLFLQEFVEDKKWIHFDIAGTAMVEGKSALKPEGASGVCAMTLYKYFEEKSAIAK